MGSANGSYVNGQKVSNVVLLKDKDLVDFGQVEFLFVDGDDSDENKKALKKREGGFLKKIFSRDFNFSKTTVKNPLNLLLLFQLLTIGLISVSAGEDFNAKTQFSSFLLLLE